MELLTATEEGEFETVKPLKGGPVTDEVVIEQIKQSVNIDAPVFRKRASREGSFIFCAGGPTLAEFLDEIRERSKAGEYVCASNKTYDYLVENGIVPNGCMIIDPKEICNTYIQNPQKESEFFIGTVCHPSVIQNLLDKGMTAYKLLVGYGLEKGNDVDLQLKIYPEHGTYLVGGTMAGLRAMNFAPLMGFSKIEYYGFDSCYSNKMPALVMEDDPRYPEALKRNKGLFYEDGETGKKYCIDEPNGGFFYAYKKKRGENIQVAKTPDGKRFLTSPCFAHQANQAIKWIDRMYGKLDVVIHGDGLTANLLRCTQESRRHDLMKAGDMRWTPEYAEIQKAMHGNENYGKFGIESFELMGRGILGLYAKLKRPLTLLDYGCGDASASRMLQQIFNILNVTLYDPFQEQYNKEPEGVYDITVCFDVMEHVEHQCVDNTLRYIAERTKYMAIFNICFVDALKTLPDGRNAHITQRHPKWWIEKLSKYFLVAEEERGGEFTKFICQALNANEILEEEIKGEIQ